jgi:deoxyadenosine/deoxycytidine kinase
MSSASFVTPTETVFVGISGIIGAGKTTLATHLGRVMNLPVFYEGVINNEYLSDFYQDMKKYAFPLQIYLLNKRFRQHQQIIWQVRRHTGLVPLFMRDSLRLRFTFLIFAMSVFELEQEKGGVQDRTIYEDSVFCRMLMESGMMDERDYRCYIELFNNMANFMRKPNLIIHLDVVCIPFPYLAGEQRCLRSFSLLLYLPHATDASFIPISLLRSRMSASLSEGVTWRRLLRSSTSPT